MSAVCPECQAGKCPNCLGDAWDDEADAPTDCSCAANGHGAPTGEVPIIAALLAAAGAAPKRSGR